MADVPSSLGTGALLDAVCALVLVLTPDGRCVFANHASEEAFGRSGAELTSQHISALAPFPPLTSEPVQKFETALPSTREGERIIRWTCRAVQADGEQQGPLIVCTGTALTAEERLARTIREKNFFLQTLLDQIPNPIFYKNVEGLYLGCNEAYSKWIGLPRERIVGQTVYGISPRELADIYLQRDLELFRNPGVQMYESQVRTAEGDVRDVLFYKATYPDSAGNLAGLIGLILDITDRKRAERALESARSELEDRVKERTAELARLKEVAESANRTKSEFLNVASHELRTPLTSLLMIVQRARRSLGRGATVDAAMLDPMERHIRRLSRLAGDILDVSRLESGELQLQLEEKDLRELVRRSVEDFQRLHPRREIRLQDPDEAVMATLDATRIEQLVSNLLDNALKYSAPETPVEVLLQAVGADGAEITVTDRGPGIPREELEAIFQRYYRRDLHSQQAGMGLGLYIAREIARRHGGDLRVESSPEGSAFVITLPLQARGP